MKPKRAVTEIRITHLDSNQKFVSQETLRKYDKPKTRKERKETARAIAFEAKHTPLNAKQLKKLRHKVKCDLRRHDHL